MVNALLTKSAREVDRWQRLMTVLPHEMSWVSNAFLTKVDMSWVSNDFLTIFEWEWIATPNDRLPKEMSWVLNILLIRFCVEADPEVPTEETFASKRVSNCCTYPSPKITSDTYRAVNCHVYPSPEMIRR